MIRNLIKIFIITLCLLAGLSAGIMGWASRGLQARIKDIQLNTINHHLALSFALDGIFTEAMVEALERGIPIRINFYISFYKTRTILPNKTIFARHVSQHLQYDIMKDRYLVERSWSNPALSEFKDFTMTRHIVKQIKDIVLLPLSRLEKGEHYMVRVRSKMVGDRFLASRVPWAFKTDWYAISFIYR